MSEPIVFIGHFKVKEGKLDGLKQFAQATTEQIKAELEFIVLTRREVYGTPRDKALAMLRPPEGSRITLTVMPQPMGGYIRFKPG